MQRVFPGIVSGYAYFEKLSTSNEGYSDYRKLSNDEVAIIENTFAWQSKRVKHKGGSFANLTLNSDEADLRLTYGFVL